MNMTTGIYSAAERRTSVVLDTIPGSGSGESHHVKSEGREYPPSESFGGSKQNVWQ